MAHEHPPALFVAGSAGLDFLNSVATPTADIQIDWLDTGDGLLAWLKQAHLVSTETLDALQAQAMPGELDRVAAQARSLREWFRTFVHVRKGRPLSAVDLRELEPLNRLLQRDEEFSQIVAPGQKVALELQTTRRWRSPESLLLPVGQALAQFVCDEDFSDVKACEGPNCTLMFVDHTRGRMRRWCSMALCGNRTKAAAHRKRLKATQ
ncbi:MAG TPA: CGNR zinc finger domain-containing protein [Dongiaceae bacterium]|nr:CGNR zinc finger domain-containing protein [Dongiaceae bacterium]